MALVFQTFNIIDPFQGSKVRKNKVESRMIVFMLEK